MNWENRLIGIYLKICDLFDQGLSTIVQRMSPNQGQEISNQEIVTLF